MRAVNLLPPEDRRGGGAPTRAGVIPYVLVGVLAFTLVAVCAVVLTNKQISDREAEVSALEADATALEATAASLARYTTFQGIRDARVETVAQLAQSRFDWERVLRELSIVMPSNVWLTGLAGSVTPEAGAGGSENPLRASIAGPALELSGCGRSHRDVARLIAAMRDIDGVTRVSATDSEKSDTVTVAPPAAGPDGEKQPLTSEDCQTRSSIPKFNLIAAFDEVPVPAAGAAPPATAPVEAPAAETAAPGASSSVDEAQRRTDNASGLVQGG
jgi:Tfp pilus assembly protein PilN